MIFFGFGMLMTFLRRYGYAEDAAAFSSTLFKRPGTLNFDQAFELVSESWKQTTSREEPVWQWTHEVTLTMDTGEPYSLLQDSFDSRCQRTQDDIVF